MRMIAIPIKSLERSKRRLKPVLSPVERAALSLAMLEDVLDATLAVRGWHTVVVSPDEVALETAARRSAEPLPERRPGLREAVLQVEREALRRACSSLAVLLADVACVTPGALSEALETLGPVVAAAGSDGGTTMLLRRPPRCIPAQFGPGSLERHRAAAASRGLPFVEVRRHELALDLDEPKDLVAFARTGPPGRVKSLLQELDVESRGREPGGGSRIPPNP